MPADKRTPAERLLAEPAGAEGPPLPVMTQLAGHSVLILEDQALIALDIEFMVRTLGADACWLASNVAEALSLLETVQPSFALLDFDLGRETAEPVADLLLQRGVPFVFVTGFGLSLLVPERLARVPILGKPLVHDALLAACRRLTQAAG